MFTKQELRAAHNLLDAVAETAIDVFWGGDPNVSDEEAESLTSADYDAALEAAMISVLFELSVNEDWQASIMMLLSEQYGKEVWKRLMCKELAREEVTE